MEKLIIDIDTIYCCPRTTHTRATTTNATTTTAITPNRPVVSRPVGSLRVPMPIQLDPDVIENNPTWTVPFSSLNYHPSWKPMFDRLRPVLDGVEREIFVELNKMGSAFKFYPPENEIFNAFLLTPLDQVKVVILGQDCYHEEGQAHGLCFSVPDGVHPPQSLVNIYKELGTDIPGFKRPTTGNLTPWARQGVLLINCAMSVMQGKAGTHLQNWKPFTDRVIEYIASTLPNIIFLLWGGFAQNKKKIILNSPKDTDDRSVGETSRGHIILEAVHPSPLSANHGGWFGCKHFSRVNQELEKLGKTPINWQL